MPNNISLSPSVSPSKTGSAPVKDVLQRIQVRDLQRALEEDNHRPVDDVQLQWPVSWAALISIAIISIAVSFLILVVWKPAAMRYSKSTVPMTVFQPQEAQELSVPQEIHQSPRFLRRRSSLETSTPEAPVGTPTPVNFHGQFLAPRTMEFQWDSMGDGYRYFLYSAATPSFDNAQPALANAVPSTHAVWIPEDNVDSIWMAVRAVAPDGHTTPFSRPVQIQLPPA